MRARAPMLTDRVAVRGHDGASERRRGLREARFAVGRVPRRFALASWVSARPRVRMCGTEFQFVPAAGTREARVRSSVGLHGAL